jgi:outer membrane receptor for ferric coprogen and ferric-rhodotorulic acid
MPIDYPRSQSSAPAWAYWNNTDQQAFTELSTQWGGGWQSKVSLNYRDIRSDAKQFLAQGAPDAVTGLGLASYASLFTRIERQLSADITAKGPFKLGGRTHELMLGLNWARSKNDLYSRDDAVGDPLPPVWSFNGNFPEPAFDKGITGQANFVNHHRSLYAAANFSLADELKLITGANLTRISSTGTQYGEGHDFSKSKVMPYVGAVYDFDRHHSAYASYTGIFNPQYKIDRSRRVLDPIEGSSIETGLKGEWLDKRLNGSVALFRARQKNTAEYEGFENGYSYYKGVDATSEGFELDLAGELLPGWQVNTGFTHLFSLKDAEGKNVRTFIPKNTFHVGTAYRVRQMTGLSVGANVTWQSKIFRDQGETAAGFPITSRQAAYAVFNLMARYDLSKQLSVALNINNVFDKKYLASLYWSQSYYAPPRNTTVSLNWRY